MRTNNLATTLTVHKWRDVPASNRKTKADGGNENMEPEGHLEEEILLSVEGNGCGFDPEFEDDERDRKLPSFLRNLQPMKGVDRPFDWISSMSNP
jgi:hypothetical protein